MDLPLLDVTYQKSEAGHNIEPVHTPAAVEWLGGSISDKATAPLAQEGR